MNPADAQWDNLLPYIIATLGLIGSAITGFFTWRERRARAASDLAQAKAETNESMAIATEKINLAAAAAVDTLHKITDDVRAELLLAEAEIDALIAQSVECVEENRRLLDENKSLKKYNDELLERINALHADNRALKEQLDDVLEQFETLKQYVDKHIGLTEDPESIE